MIGSHRRAAVVALLAFVLPVLLIFIGFSIDLANMQRVRTELRIATDLAAKSAAETLARTGDMQQAREAGIATALANQVAGEGLELRSADFEFGNAARQSDGKWSFASHVLPKNAVRINGARTASSAGGSVSLFFGNLIGRSDFEPSFSATAAFQLVDICLVLDRSSSMKKALHESPMLYVSDSRWCSPPDSASRWDDLDTAVRVFVSGLSSSAVQESLAMVTFSGDADSVSSHDCSGACDFSVVSVDQPLTTEHSEFIGALNSRSSSVWNGNTDIHAGLTEGISILEHARPGARRVLILFSDGQYTEDNPVPLGAAAAASEITVHTITFGPMPTDPDDTWIEDMQQIAADGNGIHMHAPTAADLTAAFEELASSISLLVE